jgi:putative addiction module component (TIGR02574 family)
MTKAAQKLLREAMSMRPRERARVAQELLLSLDPALDPDVDAAWQEEAARRLREIDKGDVQTVTWESVRDRLRKPRRATG